jgi:predicted HTH transcriptional regulator
LPGLEFYELADSFVVIFRRKSQRAKKTTPKAEMELTKTQEKIIRYLEENGEASTYDLIKNLRLAERTVQRNLKQLKEIITWTGQSPNDPKGKYVLKKFH